MKKFLSLFLAVLMLMTVVALPASAYYIEGSYFERRSGTEGAYSYKRMYSNNYGWSDISLLVSTDKNQLKGTVTIPSKLGTVNLTDILSSAFEGNNEITKIIWFPETSARIHAGAFKNCKNLKEVVFGNNVRAIDEGAFEGCTSLEVIHYSGHSYHSDDWKDTTSKSIVHPNLVSKNKIEAVCSQFKTKKEGREAGLYCNRCQKFVTGGQVIPAEHIYSNSDGICDRCHEACPHKCHLMTDGIAGFFFKIELFFWKLFKIQKTCICGVDHY